MKRNHRLLFVFVVFILAAGVIACAGDGTRKFLVSTNEDQIVVTADDYPDVSRASDNSWIVSYTQGGKLKFNTISGCDYPVIHPVLFSDGGE